MSDRVIDVIWSAGIFDGEGTVSILQLSRRTRSGYPNYQLRVSVGVRRDSSLSVFQELFKGSISDWEEDGSQPAHSWVVSGVNALEFLNEVYPYLRWKKDRATLGIAFQEHMEDKKTAGRQSAQVTGIENELRKSLHDKLYELNHKKIRVLGKGEKSWNKTQSQLQRMKKELGS